MILHIKREYPVTKKVGVVQKNWSQSSNVSQRQGSDLTTKAMLLIITVNNALCITEHH